jgi:hypothetical protein
VLTTLKKKSGCDSEGVVLDGLMIGSFLELDTPAAATDAPEHTSPSMATAGQQQTVATA